ncbi:hypothetical protein GZ78_00860 [Endozoicomonas numazuensis]|uniref:Uncharacterized protein n=2 Tax=Endozoicomonas numazuensis TaxID=1137799 RepID=A0A081NJS7_9GAMM|nr:hypothetical protein GZ78_00860 [Endozoicomonas numazuensis]
MQHNKAFQSTRLRRAAEGGVSFPREKHLQCRKINTRIWIFMRLSIYKAYILIAIIFLSGCSTIESKQKSLVISGNIELPILLENDKYWLDSGPLFISSLSPLITYRVINKSEIEFAESEKTVYNFIKSSFSNPEGISEESFYNSHKDYKLTKNNNNNIELFILSNREESKAYIVSESIDFGIEILIQDSDSLSVINKLSKGIKLL